MKNPLHDIVPNYFDERVNPLSERTNITNFLLLMVLAGVILVSGSLQCAFDCLTRVDNRHSSFPLLSMSDRVDTCHPSIEHAAPTVSCLNKACHQRLPHHRDLAEPEIYRLEKLEHPLYSSFRQTSPLYRAGSIIVLPTRDQQPELRFRATSSDNAPQTLSSIRTTVLLC